ncbi:MotA/TolQ/ExbB proton channel family protein [Fidelibacter multiformis]|jgi:biopolymer transport protein ExbB|uniref:MotA/TolQ/ExbB proton channel family protein n=1 Tax=Fidelibacter multiformis TaxID=3377529 RepID=UPI0037DC7489
MVELFVKGGPFMPWILGVFIFGLIIVFERFYSLTAAELRTRSFLKKIETILREEGPEAAKEECEKSSSPVAAIYHEALSRMDQGLERVEKVIDSAGALEMAFLEKNQIWLTTVVTIAPMLGFIGTVSGMVGAFNDVAAANDISPAIVASGISEALLTTLFGLIVAVIISIFQNWFMSRIDKMVIDLEKSAVTLVDVLSEKMKK